MVGLLEWVAYNALVSPPRMDIFSEDFSIVAYYLKLFILAYAALAPVALLFLSWKWLYEKKQVDRSRTPN